MSDVKISISADEWRALTGWMWRSLVPDENDTYGHFLLECDRSERRWVATDAAQLVVHRTHGSPVRGDADSGPYSVALNPRLFRWRDPADSTIVVSTTDDGERVVCLETDGVDVDLLVHPGTRVDWRPFVDDLDGLSVQLDTRLLREAVTAASAPPFGQGAPDVTIARLHLADGRLWFTTPWSELPSTCVTVPVDSDASADGVLFDLVRLAHLVEPLDLPTVTLVFPSGPKSALGLRSHDYDAVLMPYDPLGGDRVRLEELLREFTQSDEVRRDEDGDYPLDAPGDVRLYVRLVDADVVTAQVFSVIAGGVEPDVGLFEEINSINANSPFVKLVHAAGALMAEIDLVAETLDQAELTNALRTVRKVTEQYRDVVSIYFGGSTELEDPPRA